MGGYTKDLIDLLGARADNGSAAFEICKLHETKLVAFLKLFGLSRLAAEELLHDVMREHERALFAALRDHVHVDDAIDAVHQIFGDE